LKDTPTKAAWITQIPPGRALSPGRRAAGAGSRLESKSPRCSGLRAEHFFQSEDAIELLAQLLEALEMGLDESSDVIRDRVHGF